jgi:hypothetical protein
VPPRSNPTSALESPSSRNSSVSSTQCHRQSGRRSHRFTGSQDTRDEGTTGANAGRCSQSARKTGGRFGQKN